MATRIRLAQRGRKALKLYDIVVADTRAPRDGKFIEKLGTYNPNVHPVAVTLNEESTFNWLMKGAQPTDTTRMILSQYGLMLKRHLQIGVDKGAVKQEEADKKYEVWKADKDKQIQTLKGKIGKEEEAQAKARFEAETKIAQDRLTGAKQKAAEQQEKAEAPAEGGEETAEAVEATEQADVSAEASTESEAPVAMEEAPAEEAKEDVSTEAEAKEETPAESSEEVSEDKEEESEKADESDDSSSEAKEEDEAPEKAE